MNIALIGYGKMGKTVEEIARKRGHEIACIVEIDNPEAFCSEAFKQADVAIEFTCPGAAYGNCMKAFDAGVKLVSGSTGWIDGHLEEIRRRCAGGATLFWSSNFSLGVSVFSAVNRYLASIMNDFPGYDVTMSETHHIHKLDAPSGTAITLANDIVSRLDRKSKWVKGTLQTPDGKVQGTTSYAPDELPVHAIREGEVPGIHRIRYESEADSITLIHDAKNRRGFALGAVLAAEFTATHQGLLGMDDLFPFLQ
ncbi:MAG: 4-hydroxy-tetrahydrodipicolinate reductase [Prevotellaceae bacterium]|nr:4-hydroxy-tetrahydrodipicolinate reductase [Prevotellaceae bacterium]